MRVRVYKALDSDWSFFGIRAGFLPYTAIGVAASFLLGFIIGVTFIGIIGVVVGIAGVAATLLWVLTTQAHRSDKEQAKWLAARRYPHYIHISPKDINLLKNCNGKPEPRI